jgi:DNA-directed RNA polymerase specialized sigma24 family protein
MTPSEDQILNTVSQELARCPGLSQRLRELSIGESPVAKALGQRELVQEVREALERVQEVRPVLAGAPNALDLTARAAVGARMADGVWVVAIVDPQFLKIAASQLARMGASPSAADDVQAEAGLRASRTIRNGGHYLRLVPYIVRVIHNTAHDYRNRPDNGHESLPGTEGPDDGNPGNSSGPERRQQVWEEPGAADEHIVNTIFGPDDCITPGRVAAEIARLPARQQQAVVNSIDGMGQASSDHRQALTRGLVGLTLVLADEIGHTTQGQSALLSALASAAATKMQSKTSSAWKYVEYNALDRFQRQLDRGSDEDRHKVERLLAIARCARDGGPQALLEGFLAA